MEKNNPSDYIIQFGCLVAYKGHETDLVIPETVSGIGKKAFEWSSVRSVVLPETVVEVEQEAFNYWLSIILNWKKSKYGGS